MRSDRIIFVKNLKIIRQGNEILKGIDLQMYSNQHIGIIGPNGAGKSFLLQVLSADLIPSSGLVEILGKQFGKVNLFELRKEIGYVSNRMFYAFESNMTCLEVVCTGFSGVMGLPDGYTKQEAKQTIEILEFFGVEYLKDRKFEVISDGERRKIMLCRAIVTDPKLLIFDEPCQGLDIPSREFFLNDVDKLSKKIPILYVTHHLEELPGCITDLILLKKGEIFVKGKKNVILTSKNISDLFDYNLEVTEKDGKFLSFILKT